MGRDAVRMSPEEVAEFLAGQLKVQVASNGADGTPHLTTLFYVLGADGLAEVERQAAKRVVVVVRAAHVASWDHAKLVG